MKLVEIDRAGFCVLQEKTESENIGRPGTIIQRKHEICNYDKEQPNWCSMIYGAGMITSGQAWMELNGCGYIISFPLLYPHHCIFVD